MKSNIMLPCLLAAILLSSANCQYLNKESKEETSNAPEPPGATWEGKAFTFHKIREDIYQAIGTGNLTVGANGGIIINENDVMIVDSHITPAAAWALQKELATLTDKPIRYVVNTHFHYDHAHGNEFFFGDRNIEIIGHRFTREKLESGESKYGLTWRLNVGDLPTKIKNKKMELAAITNDNPELKEQISQQLAILENYQTASNALIPTPPTITLTKRLKLNRGNREIQLLFFGRGHTGGDVVVFLPKERVLLTGDLLTSGIAYMGDAYLREWAETLEKVKSLDFDVILPGHGSAFTDRNKIDNFQAYLLDMWSKIAEKHSARMNVTEAAKTIDMTNHNKHYPTINSPGISRRTVERVYALLDGTEK